MATLLEKLSARIVAERQEILRIKADAISNEQAAQARLRVLEQAAEVLSQQPRLEALITSLGALGIKVGE